MTSTLRRNALFLAAAIAILAGCSSATSEQKLALLRADAPLREPAWVPEDEALLALDIDRRRLVRVDVGEAQGSRAPVRAVEYEDLGENVVVSHDDPGRAYLPRPASGRVSVVDTRSLETLDAYAVPGSPAYATLDVQSEVLFALSEDGSRVGAVELESFDEIPAVEVEGSPATLVEAPEKGLEPAFWTAGPGGVAFYHGVPPERVVGRQIEATDIAVDLTSAQRVYVAEGERVVAFEGDPQRLLEGRLLVDATRSLGEAVEHVASDELHVFAATEDKLVALRRETLQPAEVVEFGRLLERKGIASGGISGIAVGEHHVYLTLEEEPYLLSVSKP
jgi:hypothetical protein